MKKKTNTFQFQIPKPCAEKWNQMHALPGGRFCDLCEKTVVDFTQMTDNELIRYFEKSNQNVCGQFRPDQLNRDMTLPKAPSSFQKWKAIAAVAAGLLSWNTVAAQSILPKEKINIIAKKSKAAKGEKSQLKKTSTHFSNQKLKGIIQDENGEPLIAATVLLEKSNGTVTDLDGKFELEIPQDWESFEVTFSYIGFETQIIEFDKVDLERGKIAEVKMKFSTVKLKTLEVVGQKVKSQSCSNIAGLTILSRTKTKGIFTKEKEPKKEESISISNIYPNPFVDFITIKLQVEKESSYLFHLYNGNGQMIWTKKYDLAKGEQALRLDFSEVKMAQGNHFLRIINGNQEIQTKKIIKVNRKGGELETNVPSSF